MNKQEALKFLEDYFKFNTEARSYMQDETEDGCFTHRQALEFDDETLIEVAEDLQDQIREELYNLIN